MRKRKQDYTFLDFAKDVLEDAQKPLTISQIWKSGEKLRLVERLGSAGKTPINTLQARLYIDIRDNKNSIFVQTNKRPSMFYIKNKNIEMILSESIDEEQRKYNERDLHILLSSFVYASPNFRCMTKTIFHEKTNKSKKGYNQWLHPDIVGVHFPFEDYSKDTLVFQEMLNDKKYRLYAFEMKVSLSFSNLREYYFQAVSNSSWANEGYLVALNIDEDESFMSELKRLNNAFGIGVIRINAYNVSQSEVLLTAKENISLDWDTIDRLTENPDFKDFINDIMEDAKVNKIKSQYDDFFVDDETAEDYAKKKHII